MSDTSIFNRTIEKNGYNYYIIPSNYSLFKASKMNYSELRPNNLYFFGLKNMDPEYIYDYEDEYGVIYEYETTNTIELLALDNKVTINKLYSQAPQDIKHILERNYGYNTGTRLSEKNPDMKFTEYLCNKGFQGYAIYSMKTDFGGHFHPELAICNASNSVELVQQITSDYRIQSILEQGKMRQIGRDLDNQRASKKRSTLLFNDVEPTSKRLFDDDDDFNGGKNKLKKKKSRKNKNIKKIKKSRKHKKSKRKYY